MQSRIRIGNLFKAAAIGLSLAVAAACSGDGDEPQPPAPTLPAKASIASLTNVSSDNYANNRWGLIEASTLETFVNNWNLADTAADSLPPNGRPAHLASNARLVILQLTAANRAAGEDYIPSNPTRNVYTFQHDPNFRFNETRDTGLILDSVSYQASGPRIDAWLADYGIDLSRDFVVIAAGAASDGFFFQELGRATYWLSYWGADVKKVAIVNGTLQRNYAGTLVATSTPHRAVSNNNYTVKSLRVDGTGITVALEDVLKVVDAGLQATDFIQGFNRQVIIDARPTPQFFRNAPGAFNATHPGQYITTAWNSFGGPGLNTDGSTKTYVPYEGHIKGATSFPWAALLDSTDGNWRYRTKAELEDIFLATAGYSPADRTSKVIVSQCRTNFEVQVNGFAARLILGYPTVFYDGSLVEYTSLVSQHPDSTLNLQPGDPAYRFRTDTAARSQRFAPGVVGEAGVDNNGVTPYNEASGTGAADRRVAQARINRTATTTRKALDADRDYKLIVE